MSNTGTQLPPGFRFHPTDEELILHYLRNRAAASPCPASIIAEIDIYKFDPWDLPAKAAFGDREWYFFSPRDRKYPNGVRPNRAAASGYWKATGTDKPIGSGKENIGVKKALVFYRGRPPKGLKTNWIMHEYRLAEAQSSNSYKPITLRNQSMRLDDWVLCRIYKKNNHLSPALMDQEQEIFDDRMPKTLSVSEFLEDNSVISNLFNCNGVLGHPLSNQSLSNGCFLPQLSQVESPVGNVESKKQNEPNSFPSFSGQFDGSEYSLVGQPFFSHELMTNYPLGSLQ